MPWTAMPFRPRSAVDESLLSVAMRYPGGGRRRRARLACAVCLLGLAVGAAAALAAGGDLDQGFSGDGKQTTSFGNFERDDIGRDVAIQPDGRLLVVGRSDQATGPGNDNPNYRFALARYMPDGSLDQSFSGDGRRTLGFANRADPPVGNDAAYGVAIQPNGRIVAAGVSYQRGTGYDFAVARFKPNGYLDRSFSGDGMRTFGFANDAREDLGYGGVAIQPNGKIVVAGASDQGTSTVNRDFAVARLNPDGSLDRSFSGDGKKTTEGGGDDLAYGVAIQANGRIVLAGYRQGLHNTFAVARYRADGRPDRSFSGDGRRWFVFPGATGNDIAYGVVIGADGKIVVAGYSNQVGQGGLTLVSDFAVAQLNPDGRFDQGFSGDGRQLTSFGPSVNAAAFSVAIQADGRIVAVGSSAQGTGTTTNRLFALARYMPDGSLDQSFSGDGKQTTSFVVSDSAYGVAIQPDGRILVAGASYQGIGTGYDMALARYLGS